MNRGCFRAPLLVVSLVGLCVPVGVGCKTCTVCPPPPGSPIPRELRKVSLPPYVIEPPDILVLDAINLVPKPPFRISPLDSLLIQATETIANEPIAGVYVVEPDGTVNLGASYGAIQVADLTLDEARATVEKHLKQVIKNTRVTLALAQSRGLQQVRGEHLVGPDGTINLGSYGTVSVTGLTIPEAKAAIEAHLAQYLKKPEVSISISGYNSKVYYVIFDGGGYGQQMYRLPVTGNETVLDALSQIYGLPPVASLKDVWVARPAPDDNGCDQVLPVDLCAITDRGATATNYQIMPGDRVHVKADGLITLDNTLAKIFAPLERIFGVTLLGTETAHQIRFFNTANGSGTGF